MNAQYSRISRIKYLLFSFRGRINRSEYWAGIGLQVVLFIPPWVIGCILAWAPPVVQWGIAMPCLFSAAWFLIISCAALNAKRWHDRNKGTRWLLILLIPYLGIIWALIENGFLRGATERNEFGEPPTISPQS